MAIQLKEWHESGYRGRTKYNADSADMTIAFACDYSTAGEKLTKQLAQDKYCRASLHLPDSDLIHRILTFKESNKCSTVNIAGNGIYTLDNFGYTQSKINYRVCQILKLIHGVSPFTKIYSGGQTGVDTSGAHFAYVEGVDAEITFPRGWIIRGLDGVDRPASIEEIKEMISES